jgi:hypothetical protein
LCGVRVLNCTGAVRTCIIHSLALYIKKSQEECKTSKTEG